MKPQPPSRPSPTQSSIRGSRQPRVQRYVPRYMAYPPRYQQDSAMRDAAVIAWAIVLLLVMYLIAPLVVAR